MESHEAAIHAVATSPSSWAFQLDLRPISGAVVMPKVQEACEEIQSGGLDVCQCTTKSFLRKDE